MMHPLTTILHAAGCSRISLCHFTRSRSSCNTVAHSINLPCTLLPLG